MKTARQLTVALLLVLALSAFIGGYFLLSDTSGHLLQLSVDDLKGSPFKDYGAPAWLLIVFVGIFSVLAAAMTYKHTKGFEGFIIVEGAILLIFIISQTILIQELRFTQVILGLCGFALLLLGSLIRRIETAPEHHHPQHQIHHSQANAHKKSHYHKHRKRG